MYRSTKTYGHEIGMSCCFRQWRAESHCRFFHGYALSFHFEFASEELDVRNWVVDFGSLKSLKGLLEDTFDHKLVVAEDDPMLDSILHLEKMGLAEVRVLPAVGCEKFAELAYQAAESWLQYNGYSPRVHVASVMVKEHGANGAIYDAE